MHLELRIEHLYRQYGPGKQMGIAASDTQRPHYFLHRNFLGEQDLLIIFNTKRCRYQCNFCDIPSESSREFVSDEDILSQFEYVANEVRHSLGVLDRVSLSNSGSVLDASTFPTSALITIVKCTYKLRNVKRIVLETRLEFVDIDVIRQLQLANPRAKVTILTGFESLDPYIRDVVLGKRQSIEQFLLGLDKVAQSDSELMAYVLFKPSYQMTDDEAIIEAEASIDFLHRECLKRNIPLSLRIGPMYAAAQSKWAREAFASPEYKPPRLTDVLELAKRKIQQGIPIYIGLSSEGLAEDNSSYLAREDFSKSILSEAILLNQSMPQTYCE